jgi:hypothetical protein
MDDDFEAPAPLIEAMRAHVRTHPGACDFLRGVAEWWLGDARAGSRRFSLSEIESGLDQMVLAGELRCIKLRDGESLYLSPDYGLMELTDDPASTDSRPQDGSTAN